MQSELTKIILAKKSKEESLRFCEENNAWKDLSSLCLSENYQVSWRATWLLGYLSSEELHGLSVDISALLRHAQEKGHSLQREVFKLLEKLPIPEEELSLYFDWAERLWMDRGMQSSVRITALRAMARVAIMYPDLKGEILALGSSVYLESLSSGIQKQARAIFQSLDRD